MQEKHILFLARANAVIVWATISFYIATAFIVESPLRPSRSERITTIALMPQGWGFFTRSPREPTVRIYKKVGSEWELLTLPNSSVRNIFGLKRESRVLSVELASLLIGIPKKLWKNCEVDPLRFANQGKLEEITVQNTSNTKRIIGHILVVRQPLVPWAWSESSNQITMPSEIILLNVKL